MNYAEAVEQRGEISGFSFIFQEGDYVIGYPPKEGSFLHDGWFGIFRMEEEEWKIIAGD